MSEANIFKPHSIKQDRAIFSKKKITAVLTGIQWGKTRVGALRIKHAMHTYTGKDDAFLIVAPTYKIMQQSTLPAFLGLMDGFGNFSKTDAIFHMNGGGTAYLRTESDPDSIVGVTNVRHVWGDEAGKYRLYFWENLQGRASFKDCPITLTSSPYARNWMYHDIVKPTLDGKRFDVELIQATSIENPYFPKEEYERRKLTMDPRRFDMMYGAEWGQAAGLVYDCFDLDQNQIDPIRLPVGTKYYAGVDWGYNPDPFVIVIRAITPEGMHYQISEFYQTGLTITDMVQVAKQKKQMWGVQAFYCDRSQPGSIEEFNRNGLTAIPANNDINRGVGLHYELIKTRKYKVFKKSSPHTLDEYETYHYPEAEDLGPDEDSKELKPVGQNDHCLDANRYVTIETYRVGDKKKPKTPEERKKQETIGERLKRLQRDPRGGNFEKWS